MVEQLEPPKSLIMSTIFNDFKIIAYKHSLYIAY